MSACACLAFPAFRGIADDLSLPKHGESSEPNLLAQTGWVRVEIIGGRVAVLSHRYGQSRTASCEGPRHSRQDLTVQMCGRSIVVNYEAEDYLGRRSLTVDEAGTVRATRLRYEAEPREVTLVQPLEGKLKVILESGGSVREVSAGSLWHLILAEPQLCHAHLIPLLESFRPELRIADQAAEIRSTLLASAGGDILAQRQQWRRWVSDLGHSNFQKRQAADQALRSVGQPVIAWLSRLDPEELDAEQRQRVRRICGELADPNRDTPDRVADWLIDDKTAWLAIIAEGQLDERIAAADHLSKLCRRTIPFDPHASHDQRRTQLAELMVRYGD